VPEDLLVGFEFDKCLAQGLLETLLVGFEFSVLLLGTLGNSDGSGGI
jgi:hypothetical protein